MPSIAQKHLTLKFLLKVIHLSKNPPPKPFLVNCRDFLAYRSHSYPRKLFLFALKVKAYIIYTNLVVLMNFIFFIFYPTSLKGCQGIVFTHGARWAGVQLEKFVQPVSQKVCGVGS